MSVVEFKKALSSSAIGSGSNWIKADFHVHYPSSSDYEYRAGDAVQALGETLREKKYKLVVLLKHQEFPSREELSALNVYCPDTKLIPGAEINVLVDALSKKVGKDYFFHCIVAVDPDIQQDYGYLLWQAKEALTYRDGEYPAGFRSSIIDVCRFFRDKGALFIPAHLHQSKAPENSRSIDDLYDDEAFLGFVRDGAFDALEVREMATAKFFDGTVTTKEGLSIPRCVCIASSDAHHHEHVRDRDRFTWVKVEAPTFSELTAALSFPDRIALTDQQSLYPQVIGVHVVGSFIRDNWFKFNSGLNALIGSKGSGKTALLECLRFALNSPIPGERLENVQRHVAHVLGSSGYVECLVQRQDGSQALVTRRSDSPDRITLTEESGETTSFKSSDPNIFPISILGWHEIEAVADKATARISLLDRVGDPNQIKSYYDDINSNVEHARDQLPHLQRQVKHLDSSLKELWDLQRKRSTLKRLEEGELLKLQQQYEWYLLTEQKLEGLISGIEKRSSQVGDAVASKVSFEAQPAPDAEDAKSALDAINAVALALEDNVEAERLANDNLQASLTSLKEKAQVSLNSLEAAFNAFRESTYMPKVNALPPEDKDVLTKQIQVLEETKRLPVVKKGCEDLIDEVAVTARLLTGFCERICAIREAIVMTREKIVGDLNAEKLPIQLQFLKSSNQASRDSFQSRHGQDGANLLGFIQGFGKNDSYENLKALFEKMCLLRVDQEQWDIKEILWDVKLIDLLNVMDDDDVEIRLQVGRAGYVPIQNLSAGQRCVAVFPLLLRNSRGPLVIDQPEDNLDNRYIADVIAPDLLHRKRNQQFLVTSHNANLVVLTDADLIVHVDSDGATSTFPVAGFLSCGTSPVRQSVLDVLDGGEVALAARQRKYGNR